MQYIIFVNEINTDLYRELSGI